MPIAVEFVFKGATLEQYHEIIEKMGLTPGGSTPPDALFHWVAKTDDGLHIVDVWESREAFDRFSQEQIEPFSAEVGITEPEMRFFDIHTYLTAS